MHVSARTYLTSGIAVLGAGAIALSPVQPMPDHMTTAAPQRAVESLAVNLAATIDPITPIVDTFNTSVANIETLVKFYLQKPFPLLTTIVANLGTYAAELEAGDGGLIPDQISNNIRTFFEAPWQVQGSAANPQITLTQADTGEELTIPGYPCDTASSCSDTTQPDNGLTTDQLWQSALQLIAGASLEDPLTNDGFAPFKTIWDTAIKAETALNLLFTPYASQVLGWLGPLLSPPVQLVKSFTAVGAYFQAGDVLGAINELINIPANTTNAFLNGAGFLDLTGVLANFGIAIPDSPTFAGTQIGVNLGGLLNAVPRNGSLVDPEDPPTQWFGLGIDGASVLGPKGTFFGDNPVFGYRQGLFGAGTALGQFLGRELLVTPPLKATAAVAPTAAAAVAPKAAAAVEAPAVPATPAEPATPAIPAIPATDETPATPAVPAVPATPAIPAIVEAPVAPEAPAVAEAPTHRGGGGNDKSDNGSRAKGHRGAA